MNVWNNSWIGTCCPDKMYFKIRNEEAKDIEQVRKILRAAFPKQAESKLVDLLRKNHKGSFRWLVSQLMIRCWGTSSSVLSPLPH